VDHGVVARRIHEIPSNARLANPARQLCLGGRGRGFLPVSIQVNASRPQGELKPIWRFFGADEPNYAYMTNGQKLIAELGELAPGKVFFRAHNLLTHRRWNTGFEVGIDRGLQGRF